MFFLLMIRRPPRSTRTDTLCPYTTRCRSAHIVPELTIPTNDLLNRAIIIKDAVVMAQPDIHHIGRIFAVYMAIDGVGKVADIHELSPGRSEERRVGKECVSTCRSRWSPYH